MKLWLVLIYVTATTYVLRSIHDTEEAARRNVPSGPDYVDHDGWMEIDYLGQRAAVRVEPRWMYVDDTGTFLASAKRVAEQREEDDRRMAEHRKAQPS